MRRANLLNHTNLKKDKTNTYELCNLNRDIEKGKIEIPKSTEESIGYLKSDDSSVVMRTLQKDICVQLGGRFMQLWMNQSPHLPKVTSKVIVACRMRHANPVKYNGCESEVTRQLNQAVTKQWLRVGSDMPTQSSSNDCVPNASRQPNQAVMVARRMCHANPIK
ncbi:hypothetical protein DH2020_015350 [Rehmannia glutinosa]|uniref:Uncharacterized protein n=1 Tax=Rehmannia glutinosa TaxID=99300 RepID=A0ABR0WSC2_REHGL